MKLVGASLLLLAQLSRASLPVWVSKPNLGMTAELADGSEVPVPQMSMDIDVRVTANVASSEMKITYFNPSHDTTLNVGFKLPVDVDTALYKFVAKYDNHDEFSLAVEEREDAKAIYERAKARGDNAVLALQDEDMHDIVKLNISNLAPRAKCEVTINTVQRLHVISSIRKGQEQGGYLKYKFATSLFSRYKLCPHENIKHPDCKKINKNEDSLYGNGREDLLVHPKFSFKLSNHKNTNLHGATRSSYIVKKNRSGNKNHIIERECSDSEPCQREYTLKGTTRPYTKDGDIVLFLPLSELAIDSYENKVAIRQGDVTMYSHYIPTSSLEEYTNSQRSGYNEYIFIVDNSNSMDYQVYGTWEQGVIMEPGQRMANAKLAVEQILNNLPETGKTYFNIIKFGCEHEALFEESKQLYPKTKQLASYFIKAMDANMHCTEILRPLKDAATSPRLPKLSANQKKQIFMITDGDVRNHTAIFDYIGSQRDNIRLFSVGIGAGSSSALIKGMADAGKGYSAFITETKEADRAFLGARSLAETVSRSLLAASRTQVSNVRLGGEVYPAFVDNVVTSGRMISIFSGKGTTSRNNRNKRAVNGLVLSYDLTDAEGNSRPQEFEFTKTSRHRAAHLHEGALKAMEAKLDLQQMHREWLDARYVHGTQYGKKHAERSGREYRYEQTSDSQDRKAGIVAYSKQTQVLCPFTAFVGVQKSKNGRPRKVVDVAVSSEIVPSSTELASKCSSAKACGDEVAKLIEIGVSCEGMENVDEDTKCGYWTKESAEETFQLWQRGKNAKRKRDFNALVKFSEEKECDNSEEVASTVLHLVYLFNKYSENSVLYRTVTRDAIDYLSTVYCFGVHDIFEKAIEQYASWGAANSKFPTKPGKPVEARDITAMTYHSITSAINTETNKWEMDYLESIFGMTEDDFADIIDWCSKRPANARSGCKNDIPTLAAIGFLYGKFPHDIEDWRLTAGLGLQNLEYNKVYLLKRVLKKMNLGQNVSPIEVLMMNTY